MIQTIISDIVSTLEIEGSSPSASPSFIQGWESRTNLDTDEITKEVVLLIWPVVSNDKIVGISLQENYSILMLFLQKSEADFTPDQHLPLVNRQRIQRNKFINKLVKDQRIESVTNIKTTDDYNIRDVNLTGCALSFNVVPIPSKLLC